MQNETSPNNNASHHSTFASGKSASVPDKSTPMIAQYLELKAAYPGYLLFYRMGDFYELFFEDAEIASRALGIALTKRGKHQGADIAMCGVPVHSHEQYLQKLIRLEHRVAVCEQMEDPAEAKKRGYKAVVKRDVVRLVTPGTLTEDTLLDSRHNNYLSALVSLKGGNDMALAWADISSGDYFVMTTDDRRLSADLARIQPREIILPDSLFHSSLLAQHTATALTPLPDVRFDSVAAEQRLKAHFKVGALDGFGLFSRVEMAALGSLLDYILLTQVGQVPHLRAPERVSSEDGLLIDAATRSNLELMRKLSGEKAGSLLATLDLTMTSGGARLLANRLSAPLARADLIEARLDEVSYFFDASQMRESLRQALARMPDLERALGRLSLGRGGPRDLAAIRDGLRCAEQLGQDLIATDSLNTLPANLTAARMLLQQVPHALVHQLEQGLGAELPLLARDGGFMAAGFSADLDQVRALRDDTRQVIATLQSEYADRTGIKNLKIRHNNMIGYFIEVTAQQAPALTAENFAAEFFHRQTVASAVRFSTTALSELEQKIASAADQALRMELEHFSRFVAQVADEQDIISHIAAALAQIDVALALAELASRNRYVRPIVDQSRNFEIVAGRHPVVEVALAAQGGGHFIANTCNLSVEQHPLWLLTGPNMAGKSTFLRQNALITIMAQIGSFVPAAKAHIGIVDRLFSRVGAADDLARGRSTFMVEMVETAAILNQATPNSLVILDEIGRGTATFDGLSIAWATVEHLHEVNHCRALFATHYHELTALSAKLKGLANATVKVREWQGEVIFLHEVVAGVADGSYGIQVARLAGLPQAVTARAQVILEQLEKSERSRERNRLIDDLPLFAVMKEAAPPASPLANDILEQLKTINADDMSPKAAHDYLYQLIAKAKS